MQHQKPNNFATRLNSAIADVGLPKGIIAERANIHRGTLSRWLGGTTATPEAENLHSLASVLHVTTSWLLTGEGEKKPVNLDDVQRLHGTVSESPMEYNKGSDRWREAYLELAKITPQNTVYGLEILIRVDPPNSKEAIQGLAALAKKNQDQSN